MTTQRWLQLATALTALMLVFMLVMVWRSAADEHARARDIGGRVQDAMERIEARANALENEAGR